jgi:hypothetical protein
MENQTIQGLWVGPSLSTMERVSISSFLANGHDYHLYVYDDVAGTPPGTTLKDASEILPPSQIFLYREHKSYAGFANFFRYKLLLERGGWWMDTDVICLQPVVLNSPYAFATERDTDGRSFVTSGIIKAPQDSELMERAWNICKSKRPEDLKWGETGPSLMHNLVLRSGLCEYIQDHDVFCPIDSARWFDAVLPGRRLSFGVQSLTVHLWNEFWRRMKLDKDESYPPSSLYEQLKQRYLRPDPNGSSDSLREELHSA